jgi:hypothetical protein
MLHPESIPQQAFRHPNLLLAPEDLLQLEMLLGDWVVDLNAVTRLVAKDIDLQAYVLQLAHDLGDERPCPPLHECIVEIGIDGLLRALAEARLRRNAN